MAATSCPCRARCSASCRYWPGKFWWTKRKRTQRAPPSVGLRFSLRRRRPRLLRLALGAALGQRGEHAAELALQLERRVRRQHHAARGAALAGVLAALGRLVHARHAQLEADALAVEHHAAHGVGVSLGNCGDVEVFDLRCSSALRHGTLLLFGAVRHRPEAYAPRPRAAGRKTPHWRANRVSGRTRLRSSPERIRAHPSLASMRSQTDHGRAFRLLGGHKMVKLNGADLRFILDQILIAEQHAAGTPLRSLLPNSQVPFGLRTVDGSFNNLAFGQSQFGAADNLFPRLLDPYFRPAQPVSVDLDGPGPMTIGTPTSYQQTSGYVFDSEPREISNALVDQTANNPAAVEAAAGEDGVLGTEDDTGELVTSPGLDGEFGTQ